LAVVAGLFAGATGRAGLAHGFDSTHAPAAAGAYLANAADCVACHTDSEHHGRPYAGGREIATPFGTFYSPNITPDPDTGIGRWSEAQFLRALRDGIRPDGANLYPVFPYTSFSRIVDADARAIWAYLHSLPAVHQRNRKDEVAFPFSWRPLLTAWKWLFFDRGPFRPNPDRSAAWNRGAYLVTALAHCGECHTPRNWLGASEPSRLLAGTAHGPDGKAVPNITPDHETGIGSWNEDDIVELLKDGQKPDFDFVGGAMGEVVNSTAKLTDADRHVIAVYLKSVPPIHAGPARPQKQD
jgi:mono/diheme cytochrome c family protein